VIDRVNYNSCCFLTLSFLSNSYEMFPINGDRCPSSYLRHFIVDIIANIPINLGETCKEISWEISLCKGVLGFRDSPFSWCMARPLRESSTRMKASSLPSFYPLCFPCSVFASCANEPIESRDTNSSEEHTAVTNRSEMQVFSLICVWFWEILSRTNATVSRICVGEHESGRAQNAYYYSMQNPRYSN